MKKALSLLLIVIIMMSLSSCGSKTVELSRGDIESLAVNATMKYSYIDDCNDLDFVQSVIEKYGANVRKTNFGMRMLFRKVKAAILCCIAFINIANKKL